MANNNIVLSWKLTDDPKNRYAYIYPKNGKYVRDKMNEKDIEGEFSSITGMISSSGAYHTNFMKMCDEVRSLGLTPPIRDDDYYGYINDDIIYGKDGKSGSVNVILISGQDGSNGSSGGSSGGSDGGGLGDGDGQAIIDQFNRELDEKLDEIRDEIEGQNESVIERITNDVKNTIENAKNDIYDAKDKIEGLQTELEDKLNSAQDALDEAKSLFENLENATSGDMKGVLERLSEYKEWINTLSGNIVTLKVDYDEAGKIGSIGSGENVADGLFTRFATSLNEVSGTVGNVQYWMAASAGTIGQMASWYDISGSSVTEAASILNASAAQITQVIKFIDTDIEGIIERKIDGIEGDIKDSIILETSSAITSINTTMNGLSGVVSSYISQLNYINGELTSMGDDMNAMDGKMNQWMTITDSAMSIASDLRESWSVESGKLSTVANLIAKTDEEGNVIYYVSGASGNEITVYITNEFNENGERIYKDFWGNVYSERQVYTYLSPVIMSYIQQTTSSITLSVVNSSAITAAIKLAITEDANGNQSIIGMVADKVVIDAELIAEAIKAKTANIGGIIIGSGIVKSMATLSGTSTPTFYLDGTSGYFRAENAQLNNAKVNGDIVAYSLKLGGTGIDDYIDSRIPSYDGITQEEVQKLFEDFIASDDFKNSIVVSGYVTEESFEQWKKNFLSGSTSGFTQEQLDYLDNLKDQIVGAEINNGITVKESGGTLVYTVKIGDNYYTWTKVDTENFIILGNNYGGKFIVKKDGLLEAHNAVIYGKIYSSEGNIGGLTLGNNMLKANDSEKKYIYFKAKKIASERISFNYGSGLTYSELVTSGINDSILELNDEIGNLTLTSGNCYFSLTQSGITLDDYNAFCIEEEKEGTVQTYALISSSDSYKDDEMGKLVIGVGPTDSNCGIHHYYKYTLKTSSDITESIGNIEGGKYKTIYLKKLYSVENCSKKNEMVEAYLIEGNKVEPITEYYFYYDYEIVTSGNETYYKDWIYVKNIANSVLDGLENQTLGYSNKDVVLGAVIEPAKHQIKVDLPLLDNGSGDIGDIGNNGISGNISGGASGGASGGGTGNNGSIEVGGGLDISFPYVGNGEFKVIDEEVILDIWNGNVKSDGILRGAMVVGTYGYAGECVEVDTTDFNTKIYADGTIITNNLISEDGYFGGDINSKGVFSGELKDATGTLNNVSITADTINTSLVVSDGKSINAVCNSSAYFIVNNKDVIDGMDYENWTVDSFVWDKQNKNGTNAGKTYSEEKILLKVPIKTGATINIPKMSGFVKRYAPRKKTNNRSSVYVNCYILSKNNYTYTVFNKMVDIPAFKGSGSKEVTFETPAVKNAVFSKGTNDDSSIGYLIIEFGMQIHLSTYSWLGLDKAAGHVYFNTNTSPIEITYKRGEPGVHIGPNGMYARGNIYLYSPNGQKGIEITDSGVTIIGQKQ
jgi:hypothetical protein